ncbi:unnamed protein product [Aspergillus oryzae]|uniref:Unnamed protein product n=2 Tax=Aspergillus oryzae TaxID=5062 RepID=A0AAN4YQ51_ASPOZ|nr:unnamed protein product [Aspergillus oryzae]GMF94771.1 unnamed protein product [Aspergillus oryzae]GMG01892.1 unnamed protein product [Aspergillus oryzae]GMG31750.1 unnamed protein product [Aspergillus oryzae]GMG43421.1 unnamed protein product [Aspergillus oryzae var. brunneus]
MKSLEAAERRTLSGNASFAKSVRSFPTRLALPAANKCDQKTHSASIVAGPNVYEADEKRKGRKVIDIDCRGLEFTDFKADVSCAFSLQAIGCDSNRLLGRMAGEGHRVFHSLYGHRPV